MQCMLLLFAFDQHKSGRDFNVQLHIRAVQKLMCMNTFVCVKEKIEEAYTPMLI